MKTAGIIAEYNPFHCGHAYQIRTVRQITGADYVVAVMSPDFVQRGAPAALDKWTRARMALSGPDHADLVLELPVFYAAGSAEYFARGAVALLDSLGCMGTLAFGCESTDPRRLMQAASFFTSERQKEPEEYRETLKLCLKRGMTYPQARAEAFREYARLGGADDDAAGLSQPNNILAVEYMKALMQRKSTITPLPIRRIGQGYLEEDADDGGEDYLSARSIRAALSRGSVPAHALPPASAALIREAMAQDCLVSSQDLDGPLHLRLLQLRREEIPLTSFLDVGQDLANRMEKLLPDYAGFDAFARKVKTRQMTEARIRRALVHILLGIRKDRAPLLRSEKTVPYARILGFRRDAQPLLHEIHGASSRPLIAKAADAGQILTDEASRFLFDQTVYSSDVFGALTAQHTRRPAVPDLAHPPVIL